MPDVYGPFDTATWGQGPWYRDAFARSQSGVFGTSFATPTTGDLPLTVSGLGITLGLGRAHVRGAGYERTGTAWSYTVPANTNATQARIDRLVLRRDLTAKTVAPLVLQGTPAATPAAPAVTQVEDGAWDLPLYSFTVPANSGAPLTNVVDERVPAEGDVSRWYNFPLRAGFGVFGGAYPTVGVRREGRRAWLRGWLTTTTTQVANQIINVDPLPAEFRPAEQHTMVMQLSNSAVTQAVYRFEVDANGWIFTLSALPTPASFSLFEHSWPLPPS